MTDFIPDYTKFYTKDIKDYLFNTYGIGKHCGDDFTKITTDIVSKYDFLLREIIKEYHGMALLCYLLASFDLSFNSAKASNKVSGLDVVHLKQAFKYGLEIYLSVSETIDDKDCPENIRNEIKCILYEIVCCCHTVGEFRIFNSGTVSIEENNSNYGTKFINYNTNWLGSEGQKLVDFSSKIYHKKYIDKINPSSFVCNIIDENGMGTICNDKFIGISLNDVASMFRFMNEKYEGYAKINELLVDLTEIFGEKKSKLLFQIIKAFSINNTNINSENCVFYKPNRKYRLYTRGILKLKHNNEDVLIWSYNLLGEAFGLFFESISNGNVNAEILDERKIKKLQGKYAEFFEQFLAEKFTSNGYVGGKRDIGKAFLGNTGLVLPNKIGEIDGLFISPDHTKIIVIEAKTNKLAAHGVQMNDELKKFNNEGYYKQITTKANYVESIKDKIIETIFGEKKENIQCLSYLVLEKRSIAELRAPQSINCINFIRLFEKLGL